MWRDEDDYRHVSSYILNSCMREEFINSFKEYFTKVKFAMQSNEYLFSQTLHKEITIIVKRSERTVSEFNSSIKGEFNFIIRDLYFRLFDNKLKNYNKNDIIDISPRKLKIKNLLNQTKETVENKLSEEITGYLNDDINGVFFGKKSQLSKSVDINHWEHIEENSLYNYLGSKNKIDFFRIEHDCAYEMLILTNDNFIDFYVDPSSLQSWEFESFFKHNPLSPIVGGIQEEYFKFKMNLIIHYRDNLEFYKVLKYTNQDIKDDGKYK